MHCSFLRQHRRADAAPMQERSLSCWHRSNLITRWLNRSSTGLFFSMEKWKAGGENTRAASLAPSAKPEHHELEAPHPAGHRRVLTPGPSRAAAPSRPLAAPARRPWPPGAALGSLFGHAAAGAALPRACLTWAGRPRRAGAGPAPFMAARPLGTAGATK